MKTSLVIIKCVSFTFIFLDDAILRLFISNTILSPLKVAVKELIDLLNILNRLMLLFPGGVLLMDLPDLSENSPRKKLRIFCFQKPL